MSRDPRGARAGRRTANASWQGLAVGDREVAPKRSEVVHSRQFVFTFMRRPMTTRPRSRAIRPFLPPQRRAPGVFFFSFMYLYPAYSVQVRSPLTTVLFYCFIGELSSSHCCRHLRAVYAVDCSESLRVSAMCVHLDVRVYLLSLRVRSNFFSCPPESESPFFEWLQAATSTPHVAAILCQWRIACEVRFPLHNTEHECFYARRSSFIPMPQGSMGMRTTRRIYPEM